MDHMATLFLVFLGLRRTACGILVPRPGIEPVPPVVEAWSPNHWTAREVPTFSFLRNLHTVLQWLHQLTFPPTV